MTASKQTDGQSYVSNVLTMYIALYETPNCPRPTDRRLAENWHTRGITLQTVESALLLGQLRRLRRPADYPKLQPIRSLYYFVPLVEEVLASPLEQDYVDYIRMTLKRLECRVLRQKSAIQSIPGA